MFILHSSTFFVTQLLDALCSVDATDDQKCVKKFYQLSPKEFIKKSEQVMLTKGMMNVLPKTRLIEI